MNPANQIIRDVCAAHGIETKCLRFDTPRSQRYARVRGEAAGKIKEATGWSDAEIGRYFGGFSSQTILRARQPKYELKKPGRKPVTIKNLQIQVRELRRRIEWLEQRALFPPPIPDKRAGTNSPPPCASESRPDAPVKR